MSLLARELNSFGGNICPSCRRDVSLFVPTVEDRRGQLVQFHRTLFAMTPHTWGITSIVVANAAVFIAMLVAGGNIMNPGIEMMLDWGANFGPYTLAGQWWRTITCMFLHFGIIHIGFNMYVLWQIGHFVERLVGNVGLFLLYFASGVAASIASLAWNPTAISAGASGAVFGVCGALLGYIAFRRDTIPGEVIKSLRSSLVTFVIYNVMIGVVVPRIDMAAHLGGFVFGVVCGLVLSQPISMESVAKRWQRNVMLLVGSSVVLPAAFLLLPPAPVDTRAIETEMNSLDQQAIERHNSQLLKMQDGAISSEQFRESLQQEVVPRWQKALELCDQLIAAQGDQQSGQLLAYRADLQKRLNKLQANLEPPVPPATE